jgi:nucleotide-binding universal stress UspA family protein
MYQRILMPTDGSRFSEAAIPYGLELAKRLTVPALFLYVVEQGLPPLLASEPVPLSQEFVEEYERTLLQVGNQALKRAQQLAQAAGVIAESKLVRSVGLTPAQIIVGEARSTDLLVMGTHGRTGLAAFILGSVTMRVLHEAPCPIVAMPAHFHQSGSDEAERDLH